LFFLGKYKARLFRVIAVLLFALVTSLLYQDVVDYLELRHPETVLYALIVKIAIVYGALVFVLLQFRPEPDSNANAGNRNLEDMKATSTIEATPDLSPKDRLAGLDDVTTKATLRSRYDGVIEGKGENQG